MDSTGVSDLYSHQSEAINHIRSNASVVVATPTASGKTLIYTLPVLEKIMWQTPSEQFARMAQDALEYHLLSLFKNCLKETGEEFSGGDIE